MPGSARSRTTIDLAGVGAEETALHGRLSSLGGCAVDHQLRALYQRKSPGKREGIRDISAIFGGFVLCRSRIHHRRATLCHDNPCREVHSLPLPWREHHSGVACHDHRIGGSFNIPPEFHLAALDGLPPAGENDVGVENSLAGRCLVAIRPRKNDVSPEIDSCSFLSIVGIEGVEYAVLNPIPAIRLPHEDTPHTHTPGHRDALLRDT